MFRIGNAPEDQGGSDQSRGNRTGQFDSAFQNQDDQQRGVADLHSKPRAIPESEILAREIKDGSLSGYVGHGTIITGDTTFKGMMRVDGRVAGKLTSENGTIIVGDGGQVDANLDLAVAIIRGTVNGDIIATQRIELGRTAKVRGNIQTASLAIDQGAFFEGSCRMSPIAKSERERPAREAPGSDRTDDEYGALAASLNAAVDDLSASAGKAS
jgi:cytoskeletal protein CcmA (bactofilin family)